MASDWVVIGEFGGPHGVRGQIKLKSATDPIEAVEDYLPWSIQEHGQWRELDVEEVKFQGGLPLVRIRHFEDRDEVRVFTGKLIAVPRSRLPALATEEYYWTDLIGVTVQDPEGRPFGILDHFLETANHDVMVILGERRYLIPFIREEIVKKVSLAERLMVVDWDRDF